MRIQKIEDNKTSFQGTFLYNDDLEEVIQHSKDRTLRKFNKLITKMQSVDDRWEYRVKTEEKPAIGSAKFEKTVTLIAAKPGKIGFRDIDTVYRPLLEPFDKKCFKHTLGKIIDFIENEYMQAAKEQPRKTLIDSIVKKLKK